MDTYDHDWKTVGRGLSADRRCAACGLLATDDFARNPCLTAVLKDNVRLHFEARVDGPVYIAGRHEGRADAAAALRRAVPCVSDLTLDAAIAHVRSMSQAHGPKWVSSRKQLPPFDHYVLAYNDSFCTDIVRVEEPSPYVSDQGIWYGGGDDRWSSLEEFGPFWWCEIPEGPKEQP